jgi:type IV pilus assembly protein PilE
MGKPHPGLNRNHGFTLAELMITIAIVAILLGLAFPSYQDYLRRSRRADAKITLHKLAVAQETYFFRNNKYAADFSELMAVDAALPTLPSDEGFYAITMLSSDFSWSMSARALALQAEDEQCAAFIITHLGINSALDADGLASTKCW